MRRRDLDELVPIVYDELHSLAAWMLRSERAAATLQPTALVNEAYLRLAQIHGLSCETRSHFFNVAARQMRRVLVDHARRKLAEKRDGGVLVTLADSESSSPDCVELIALHEALNSLEQASPKLLQVVELRYFAGLSIDETAEALDRSPATVKREWIAAKLWLLHKLTQKSAHED